MVLGAPPRAGLATIAVEELRFAYRRGGPRAVDGMSFRVSPGEVFGFLGPSGAGKSTTQRILVRLLRRYDGEVTVLGRPLADWGAGYHEQVGVSFELPNHYLKLTALENLRFFASLYSRPTADPGELLGRLGLAQHASVRVGHYSKGMQVRLSVARALLNNPDLLFLDEPTSGLDPVNARIVRDLVREQRDLGRTVFLTTHDMAAADALCDRVAFVVDGRIAAVDTPRALRLRGARRVLRVEHTVAGRLTRQEFPLDDLGRNQAFLDLLRSGAIETMHTTEQTLDDVFVAVTGRTLA